MKCLIIFILTAVASGCAGVEMPVERTSPAATPASSPTLTAGPKIDGELEKEFAKIAAEAKGKVGVAAVLIETGDSAFLNPDDRFPMQSVYKLPIAMAVVEQAKQGKLSLDQKVPVTREDFVRQGMASPLRDKNPNGGEFTVRELIRLSLVESDGTASDVQMRLVGGGSEIQSYLATLRVTDMKVVNTEKEIGRDWETQYQNWATPRASVELLRQLWNEYQRNRGEKGIGGAAEELSGAPLVIRFMVDSVTGPKRLRGLLAKGGLFVAHKTGTGGTRNGINSATNDIGLITIAEGKTVAIAVYVSDSSADEKTRELVIAKIAKAVETRWAGR